MIPFGGRTHKRCVESNGFFEGQDFFLLKPPFQPPTSTRHWLPPTAVGYAPTAFGHPPTIAGYPYTAVGSHPTANRRRLASNRHPLPGNRHW